MTIIHHVPGRIRLRFSSASMPLLKQFGAINSLQDRGVEGILSAIPGINQVKINEIVGSATIVYDQQDWNDRLWESLCNGSEEPLLTAKIATALEALGVDLNTAV